MQKKLVLWGLILILSLLIFPNTSRAELFEPNNKVGIGMVGLDDQGIIDAATMVNGDTGAYGYVNIVISEGDRDFTKWQDVCNKLRVSKLIPIFRLATRSEGGYWRRPDKEGAGEWASFLNRLNCTTTPLYIQLFNEPTHGSEWGGTVDPVNYAEVTLAFAKTLKSINANFFILAGGLDQATPHQPPNYYDAGRFWQEVVQARPDYFESFDGLSVHCYNRGFSLNGLKESGRSSVRCYEWELEILSSIGVKKELPIFITEAGWIGNPQQVASAYRRIYEQIWLPDGRVRAVTPFILSYIGHPFEPFSFKKTGNIAEGEPKYHDQYYTIKDIPKQKGNPPQTERVNVLSPLPTTLIKGSTYHFQLWLRNAGQSIWQKPEGFTIDFVNKPKGNYSFSSLYNVKPNDSTIINLLFAVDDEIGPKDLSIGLFKNGEQKALLFPWSTRIIDPLPLNFNLSVFPGKPYDGPATIQIFNSQNRLLYQAEDVAVNGGVGLIPKIKGVSLGQKYRVVVLVDFYLPRQEYVTFDLENSVTFEMLIPGDSNHDGKFSIEDVFLLPKSRELFRSFLPSLLSSRENIFKNGNLLVRGVMQK